MKHKISVLNIPIACSFLFLAFSCSKSNNSGGSSGVATDGTFTATVNGKTFTNSGATGSNAIVIIAADPNAGFDPRGDIFIELNGKTDSLGMHVPDALGTDTLGIGIYYGVYNGLAVPYVFNTVIVHITSLTSNRIKGDFSGQGVPDNAPNGPFIPITSVSFDIPLSKS